jgi:hypothetical protein
MDTVRIEYMILNGSSVIQNWTNAEGSVQNDAQIYAPRALQLKNRFSRESRQARVRIVSEQSNRVVDIMS